MLKFYKILFFNTLIVGTLISVSAYSWFGMWLGLEINLLSIIPLLASPQNSYPSESSMKYFITQTLASVIFLFSVILSMNTSEFIPQNSPNLLILVLNTAILLKTGAAPFHAWFPEVLEGLNWLNCLLMLTWQKIAPMVILMYNLNMTLFLTWIIIISSITGGILGLNQVSLRKIMAYSSINHIGWMIASMINFKKIWWSYFLIYSTINLNLVIVFWLSNTFFIQQIFMLFNSSKPLSLLFSLNFLSLGGLPPFLGFLPKWLTVNNLVEANLQVLAIVLIISTLTTLFFYLRIMLSALVLAKNESTVKMSKINSFTLLFTNLISLLGLLACTAIFNF